MDILLPAFTPTVPPLVLAWFPEWCTHTEDSINRGSWVMHAYWRHSISLGCWVLSQWKLSCVGWINLHCGWAVNGKSFTCNRTSLARTKPTAVDQRCDSASRQQAEAGQGSQAWPGQSESRVWAWHSGVWKISSDLSPKMSQKKSRWNCMGFQRSLTENCLN